MVYNGFTLTNKYIYIYIGRHTHIHTHLKVSSFFLLLLLPLSRPSTSLQNWITSRTRCLTLTRINLFPSCSRVITHPLHFCDIISYSSSSPLQFSLIHLYLSLFLSFSPLIYFGPSSSSSSLSSILCLSLSLFITYSPFSITTHPPV